jgi:hypothetical protein
LRCAAAPRLRLPRAAPTLLPRSLASQLSASRSSRDDLPGSALSPPNGTVALASLPADVLDGQNSTLVDGGVDAVLYTLGVDALLNVYADPAEQPGGASRIGARLVSLQLSSAVDGSELAIRNLSTPILLALPREPTGGKACSSNAGCSGSRRGVCADGVCVCASPYAGEACDEVSACGFWDAITRTWVDDDGCVALEPIDEPGYSKALANASVADRSAVVLCACDHLTTFAGLVRPDTIVYSPPPSSSPRERDDDDDEEKIPARLPVSPVTPVVDDSVLIGLVTGGALILCCGALGLAALIARRRRRRKQESDEFTSVRPCAAAAAREARGGKRD